MLKFIFSYLLQYIFGLNISNSHGTYTILTNKCNLKYIFSGQSDCIIRTFYPFLIFMFFLTFVEYSGYEIKKHLSLFRLKYSLNFFNESNDSISQFRSFTSFFSFSKMLACQMWLPQLSIEHLLF